MARFAIAGLQLSLSNGDNLDQIIEQVRITSARFPWVNMVLLSELATFGADPRQAISTDHEAILSYRELAKSLNIWLVPGSFYERDGTATYNTLIVINPAGEIVCQYRKMFPFAPYEADVTPGGEFVTFDVPGAGRFGVSICYDKWFPETTRALAWMGAEVILHPNLTTTIDRDVELALTRSNAATNQCYFFDINTAAPFGFGQSMVCGPGGEVIHNASAAEETFVVEVDFDLVRSVRQRGWQGLGQTLKSFRDSTVQFPQYQTRASAALSELGPLTMPNKHGT